MAAPETYDVLVVGLGAHGSAALWHLSKTGKKIAGIDRFQPPHNKGSSHGESRIIRQAYHENPLYVPLVKAAYPLWNEVSELAGKPLFRKTGGLMLGAENTVVVSGAKASAGTHGIPYEYLDAKAIKKRFPAFRPIEGTVGVLEHEAGILFPEEAIAAFLKTAAANGATIKTNEKVISITPKTIGIEVKTTNAIYQTEKLIVSAGAWINTLVPELNLPLTVNRQVLFWFRDKNARDHFKNMPIFIWEDNSGKMFYGFPDLGHGIKVGWHHGGRRINPDDLTQEITAEEIRSIEEILTKNFDIDPVLDHSAVCMYTNTPDEDFIIDWHPQYPNIVIASPCSGHGFKFSPVIGRLLAGLALNGQTNFDLTPFSIRRL